MSVLHSPILFTGQDFLHSCRHFFGLHLSLLMMAILVSFSCVSPPFLSMANHVASPRDSQLT